MIDMFEGCFTAIVTPFEGTGVRPEVDYDAYLEILELQNSAGVDGIVPCGTTGESPTLNHREHNKVIEATVEHSRGRVIAGTGSNATWEALEMTRQAEDSGAHASLQVCPYYNKPSQEGLYSHFSTIAEKVEIPLILYNIPGRSALEIAPQTMARLKEEHSHIVGVKEATGSADTWARIRELCGKDFVILSGNDHDTFKLMKESGGSGVISVASNVLPRRIKDFTHLGLKGDFSAMEEEHESLKELFRILFIDGNPVSVKEVMNLLNLPAGGFRYPLCPTTREKREEIERVLREMNLK